jgi:hypothetical protein
MESIRALIRAVSKHEKDILRMSDGNIFALSFIQSQRESRRRPPLLVCVALPLPCMQTCSCGSGSASLLLLHIRIEQEEPLHSILLHRIVHTAMEKRSRQ